MSATAPRLHRNKGEPHEKPGGKKRDSLNLEIEVRSDATVREYTEKFYSSFKLTGSKTPDVPDGDVDDLILE